MNLIPMPGYVITKPLKTKEETTKAGIIIAQPGEKRGKLESTQHGEVIEICYEDKRDADRYKVKIGDVIVYGEFSGFESDIDRQRYRFLKIEDIRAIIT